MGSNAIIAAPANQTNRKKTLVASTKWHRPAEFLEIAPRGELKDRSSEGTFADAILKVERGKWRITVR